METNKLEIAFRPGRVADLPQVREVCQDVWNGNDYLPWVWEEWLSKPNYHIFVLEKEGQLVALYGLTVQIGKLHRVGWIRGVRVATAYKRQGLAALIIEHALAESKARGLDRVRYATGEANKPMHKLADRYGFQYVATYADLTIPAYTQSASLHEVIGQAVRPLRTYEFETAWEFIQNAPTWRETRGLHCVFWTWEDLEADTVRARLEQGRIYGCFEGKSLTALAVVYVGNQVSEAEGGFFVSWLDGQSPDVSLLVRYLQYEATAESHPHKSEPATVVELMLVHNASYLQMLEKLGFHFDPNDSERVYESTTAA